MVINIWKRLSSMTRLAAIALLVLVVAFIGYQAYDFYANKMGVTPEKAIEDYFQSLATGDYEEVYRLTAKTHLTDIYGRPITHDEFIDQVKRVTNERQLPFNEIVVTRLFRHDDSQYYLVELGSSVGGTAGKSRLTVEVHREDDLWVVTYPFAILL
ncbi:MAG: hypothetical protein GX552_02040 [Chloroflexi bacterium]|jgi:hypothetical protein|nr:hypothetical protein [Chloroflexota bacterium]